MNAISPDPAPGFDTAEPMAAAPADTPHAQPTGDECIGRSGRSGRGMHGAQRLLWPLGAWTVIGLALALAAIGACTELFEALSSATFNAPLSVVIDGERVIDGLSIDALPPAHRVVLLVTLTLAGLAALLVVPIALLLLAGAVLALLMVVLGVPILAAAAVLAVALSPLILLGLLLLRLLR